MKLCDFSGVEATDLQRLMVLHTFPSWEGEEEQRTRNDCTPRKNNKTCCYQSSFIKGIILKQHYQCGSILPGVLLVFFFCFFFFFSRPYMPY